LARTKLAKETEPVGKSAGFSEYTQTEQLVIHVVVGSFLFPFPYNEMDMLFREN
jgi:hypothetical protein